MLRLNKQRQILQVKTIHPKITKQQVGDFYATLTTAQLHKPIIKVPGSYRMDLIFFPAFKRQNSGYDAVLILVNINSRYTHGRPLKGKSQAVVNEVIHEIISQATEENRCIKQLESDNGSNFVSKSFQAIFNIPFN